MLNYFLLGCGAVSLEEIEVTGMTQTELRMRSFVQILAGRRED